MIYVLLLYLPGRYKYVSKEESAGKYYFALELSDPQPVDAATYKLNAKNQHGESNANLKLNFDGEYAFSMQWFARRMCGGVRWEDYIIWVGWDDVEFQERTACSQTFL